MCRDYQNTSHLSNCRWQDVTRCYKRFKPQNSKLSINPGHPWMQILDLPQVCLDCTHKVSHRLIGTLNTSLTWAFAVGLPSRASSASLSWIDVAVCSSLALDWCWVSLIHSFIPHAARVRAERCPAKTACAHIEREKKLSLRLCEGHHRD